MEEREYITLTALKERGWTNSIIKKLNIVHDKESINPYYRSAPPTKLFKLEKIKELEQTDEFKVLFEKSQKRKVVANKAVETKLNKIKEYVHNIKIKLPKGSKEQIFKQAINHYNNLWFNREKFEKYISDYKDLDIETLERLTANMIRHLNKYYERTLEELFGKTGINYAHDYLKEKINKLVHDKYFSDI